MPKRRQFVLLEKGISMDNLPNHVQGLCAPTDRIRDDPNVKRGELTIVGASKPEQVGVRDLRRIEQARGL